MQYVGYNGTLTVQGDHLVITRAGIVARAGGIGGGEPRWIPLRAISDARIKPASRLTNGWLTLGLEGQQALTVTAGTAASHGDTIMFRHRDNEVFAALHNWLQTLAAHNRSQGAGAHGATSAALSSDDPTSINAAAAPEAHREVNVLPGSEPAAPRGSAGAVTASPQAQFVTAVRPWAKASLHQNVVGESNYGASFTRLLAASNVRPSTNEFGTVLDGQSAVIVAEPTNQYDRNAVRVLVQNEPVGYLPRDAAERYSGPLQDLAARGEYLVVPARVWIAPPDEGRGGSVTLMLPPSEGVQSFNEPPEEPHQVLPSGNSIQVTGEENHMDVLGRYLVDRERYLAVTLHLVEEQKTDRSQPYQAVEVRLDGQRVGVLTKAMSEKLADLVGYIAERNRLPVCRAVLRGSPLRAELVLNVAKSHEVTSKWLNSVPVA